LDQIKAAVQCSAQTPAKWNGTMKHHTLLYRLSIYWLVLLALGCSYMLVRLW
jgi:hypothetical protein